MFVVPFLSNDNLVMKGEFHMKNYNSNNVGDYRVAGINYHDVQAKVTFAELSINAARENSDIRVFGCEAEDPEVTFEKMSQVGDHAAVTRLADQVVR